MCVRQERESDSVDAAADADPWEKFNPLLHGGAAHAAEADGSSSRKKVLLHRAVSAPLSMLFVNLVAVRRLLSW